MTAHSVSKADSEPLLLIPGTDCTSGISPAHTRAASAGTALALIRVGNTRMLLKTEIKQALRAQARQPRVTAAAILTLALGIGATTAIFSVMNAVLIKSLPFGDTDRLVVLQESKQGGTYPPSYATFLDWSRMSRSFDQVSCYRPGTCVVLGDYADRFACKWVSANFFSTLGIRLVSGRPFSAEEDSAAGSPAVIVSDSFYDSHLRGREGGSKQNINIEGSSYDVVGVVSSGFRLSGQADLFLPIHPRAATEPRGQHDALFVVGRLKSDVSAKQAAAEMQVISRQLDKQYPKDISGASVAVFSFREWVAGNTRSLVLIFGGLVALILLIACANVATLLLGRLRQRQHEFAIRAAIGAERAQLVRQTLVESLVLSLEGGLVGLLLADVVLAALVPFVPGEIAPLVQIDFSVLVFTLLLCGLTALLFGLFPALRFSRLDLNQALRDGERSVNRAGHHRFRRVLAVSEIAMALMLVVCAGLMLGTAWQLADTRPGFDTNGLVGMGFQGATIRLYREAMTPEGMDFARYAKGLEVYNKELLRRLEALPGVKSAASVYPLPMAGSLSNHAFHPDGRQEPADGHYPYASLYSVSPSYFKTMGIPLYEGRGFTESDRFGAQGVVVVNRTLAQTSWPGQSPIGRRLGLPLSFPRDSFVVVGVVGDTKLSSLHDQPFPQIYMSCYSFPATGMLAIRSQVPTPDLISAVRGEVGRFDREAAIYEARRMEEMVSDSVAVEQRITTLLTIFAGLALVLAAIGIFGVMSQGVSERNHEIGIRMAVGASPLRALGMVLKEAVALAGAGIGAGLLGALALTRLLATWLFGVSATDLFTFVASGLLLGGIALLAAYWPARRAASTDPIKALRCE